MIKNLLNIVLMNLVYMVLRDLLHMVLINPGFRILLFFLTFLLICYFAIGKVNVIKLNNKNHQNN